jgi:hypothetical protein
LVFGLTKRGGRYQRAVRRDNWQFLARTPK